MGRFLDAIKAAERKAGRKVFEIERANGVTTIVTTYHADYIGEAALWAVTEARKSEAWKEHPFLARCSRADISAPEAERVSRDVLTQNDKLSVR